MSDPVSGINQLAQSQFNRQQNSTAAQQQPSGERSFQSVLQEGEKPNQTNGVSGAKLEQMRVELQQRIDQLPAGANKAAALLPELLDTKTRMGLMREALNGVNPQPGSTNLQGRFGQLENEWAAVENIMKSNKDLSQGELLGLQARLYQVSQHIEVLSKVVDQVTGGIKTVLNTNV